MIAAALAFLRGSEATRCSTVPCEIRGETIFQLSIPSVTASSALQATSGFLVPAEITVLAFQAKLVFLPVVGFLGTLIAPALRFGLRSRSSAAPPMNIAT